MKNIVKLLLILIFVSAVLVGCKNDSIDKGTVSSFDSGIDTNEDKTLNTQADTVDTDEQAVGKRPMRAPINYQFNRLTAKYNGETRACDTHGIIDQNKDPDNRPANSEEIASFISSRIDKDKVETEYDNIVISLGWKYYEQNSQIEILVDNLNGKYILAYEIPYLEKYDDESESWVNVSYCPDSLYDESLKWKLKQEDNFVYSFIPYYLFEPFETGIYRFELFIGTKVFYSSEFNVIGSDASKYNGSLEDGNRWFLAEVMGEGTTPTVMPLGSGYYEAESTSNRGMWIRTTSEEANKCQKGDVVRITYDGAIAESAPPQITSVISIEKVNVSEILS